LYQRPNWHLFKKKPCQLKMEFWQNANTKKNGIVEKAAAGWQARRQNWLSRRSRGVCPGMGIGRITTRKKPA
jgi:hypothetical protein